MSRLHTFVESPLGRLTLLSDGDALTGLYMESQQLPRELGHRNDTYFDHITEQLGEYFQRERQDFDLAVAPMGNAFEIQVWRALRQIPYGETWSYGQLASFIGKPGAARAVGRTNGLNPVCIVVPCHRVIGADGKLRGYSGGLWRKELLLALESPRAPSSLPF